MSNPFSYLLSRLRGVGPLNRRRAPRYEARLPFSISIHDGEAAQEGAGQPISLPGHTRNLSETGLALVVPSLHLGTGLLNDRNSTLRLKLYLPLKKLEQVEIHVVPVRNVPLGEDDRESGYIIGVQITHMGDEARALYVKYLRGLRAPL